MGRTTFPPCHGADRACAHHSCFIIHCCLANLNQLLRFAASCELSRDTRCSTDQRIKEDQHTLGQRAKPARAPAATPGSLEVKSPGTNENAVRPRPAPHYVQHRHGAATRGLCKLHTRKAARRRLTAGFRSPGAPAADRSRRRPPAAPPSPPPAGLPSPRPARPPRPPGPPCTPPDTHAPCARRP